MHLLDDVAPAHARVVSTEADLALLGRVGDNALLGAAEVVVEEILEPHAGDEQEVPTIRTTLGHIFQSAVAAHRAVLLVRIRASTESLIELHQKIGELEVSRGLERIDAPHHGK